MDTSRIQNSYEFAQREMRDFLCRARRNPQSITILISHALAVANCGAVIAPESEDIETALKITSQAHAALFALASSQGAAVTVPLGDGEPVTYTNYKSDSSCETVAAWLKGFYLAALCRDRNSMSLLFQTPLDVLRRSGTRTPEYRFLLAEALHLWWNRQGGVAQKFIETMDATAPDRPDIINDMYTLQIDVPAIQCLLYAISADPDFAEALVGAAESHKKYWNSSKKNRENRDGYLSLPLLGIAALAHDRKVPFELDCDYVPMNLVRGDD